MEKLKKEISKDIKVKAAPQENPKTIRNLDEIYINSNADEKLKSLFPPKPITSLRFQQEIISDIENVNLFANNFNTNNNFNNNYNSENNNNIPSSSSYSNKVFFKSSGAASRQKKPLRLNSLKLSRVQKKVLKIDDFVLIESQLPNIFLSEVNKYKINLERFKQFNKQLIQELRKQNVLAELTPNRVEVASNNKKLINKKAYKTYDKVFGDKFKRDFLTNKISVRQNSLKAAQMLYNTSKSKSEDGDSSRLTCKTNNVSVSNENEENFSNKNFNNCNFKEEAAAEKSFSSNANKYAANNKKTYLTSLDVLENITNLDVSDSEIIIGNLMSKNIQSKLEKFSKQIQTENSQSQSQINKSTEQQQSKYQQKKSSPPCLIINNSRGSSNNSRSREQVKANIVLNSNNSYNNNLNSNLLNNSISSSIGCVGDYNSKIAHTLKGKTNNNKSFLDNYIRLPKIVVSKININYTGSNANHRNSNSNYLENDIVLEESRKLLKGFNKTKKACTNLDSLVSKISYKIGNGFPLKKYVNNYEDFSNVYPKKH